MHEKWGYGDLPMTDLKSNKLSPIGRKWDNEMEPRQPNRGARAAVGFLIGAIVGFALFIATDNKASISVCGALGAWFGYSMRRKNDPPR